MVVLRWENKPEMFTGDDRDVTIYCGQTAYPVHRKVLSRCSKYFFNLFQENNITSFVLPNIDKEDFEYLLQYMYNGCVDVTQSRLASVLHSAGILLLRGLSHPDVEFEDVNDNQINGLSQTNHTENGNFEIKIENNSEREDDLSRNIKDECVMTNNSVNNFKGPVYIGGILPQAQPQHGKIGRDCKRDFSDFMGNEENVQQNTLLLNQSEILKEEMVFEDESDANHTSNNVVPQFNPMVVKPDSGDNHSAFWAKPPAIIQGMPATSATSILPTSHESVPKKARPIYPRGLPAVTASEATSGIPSLLVFGELASNGNSSTFIVNPTNNGAKEVSQPSSMISESPASNPSPSFSVSNLTSSRTNCPVLLVKTFDSNGTPSLVPIYNLNGGTVLGKNNMHVNGNLNALSNTRPNSNLSFRQIAGSNSLGSGIILPNSSGIPTSGFSISNGSFSQETSLAVKTFTNSSEPHVPEPVPALNTFHESSPPKDPLTSVSSTLNNSGMPLSMPAFEILVQNSPKELPQAVGILSTNVRTPAPIPAPALEATSETASKENTPLVRSSHESNSTTKKNIRGSWKTVAKKAVTSAKTQNPASEKNGPVSVGPSDNLNTAPKIPGLDSLEKLLSEELHCLMACSYSVGPFSSGKPSLIDLVKKKFEDQRTYVADTLNRYEKLYLDVIESAVSGSLSNIQSKLKEELTKFPTKPHESLIKEDTQPAPSSIETNEDTGMNDELLPECDKEQEMVVESQEHDCQVDVSDDRPSPIASEEPVNADDISSSVATETLDQCNDLRFDHTTLKTDPLDSDVSSDTEKSIADPKPENSEPMGSDCLSDFLRPLNDSRVIRDPKDSVLFSEDTLREYITGHPKTAHIDLNFPVDTNSRRAIVRVVSEKMMDFGPYPHIPLRRKVAAHLGKILNLPAECLYTSNSKGYLGQCLENKRKKFPQNERLTKLGQRLKSQYECLRDSCRHCQGTPCDEAALLVNKMKSVSLDESSELRELFRKTFCYRQSLNKKNSFNIQVGKVPLYTETAQIVLHDFQTLHGKDVSDALITRFVELEDKVLQFCRSSSSPEMITMMRGFEQKDQNRSLLVCKFLMSNLRQCGKGTRSVGKCLQDIYSISPTDSMLEDLRKEDKYYPRIISQEDSSDQIFFDGVFAPAGKSFIESLDILFKYFWVFKLEYPTHLKFFYQFLQCYFYKIRFVRKRLSVRVIELISRLG